VARQRRAGRRTDYEWANISDLLAAVDIGGAAAFGAQGLVFSIAGTVTRVRGRIGAVLDTGGAGEFGLLLCGLMTLANDSFVGGTAPELATQGVDEASWLWRGSLWLSSGKEAAVVPDQLSVDLVVDTKAMRRMKPNETLAIVFEAPAAAWVDQTGTMDVIYDLHVLVGR